MRIGRWASIALLALLLAPARAQDRKDAANDPKSAWSKLSPEERARIAENYERWKALPAEKRAELQARFEAFEKLPPERQAALRRLWVHFQSLSPQERELIRKRFERWKQLSPAERERIIREVREEEIERRESRSSERRLRGR